VNASTSYREHIFITGAPRSGTTLIKTILTAHPAIAGGDYESTGVFKIRNLYQYSCGEIENGWIQVSCEDATDLVDFYDQLADALLEYYDGRIFVDKVWPNRFRLTYVLTKFPRARWIHMVRDGRDSYCSAREHPNIPQSETLEGFARYWQRANRIIEAQVPFEKRIRLRYEDLTANPEEEICRLMEFLGLEVDPAQFNPAEAGNTPSIRKRSYHQRVGQSLDTRSVGRSREELSNRENELFMKIAQDIMLDYGYSQQEAAGHN
jgi:hypothetical protein